MTNTRKRPLQTWQTEKRRGSVLPLASFCFVIALSLLAFTLDLSRMQTQKNELNTLADASSLAAVMTLMNDTSTTKSTAVSYGQKNEVLRASVTLANSDIVCGSWNDSTRSFVASAWCGAGSNAVQVNAKDTARYLFPGLMGRPISQLRGAAIAQLGYVGSTTCVKPWAIRYTLLTKTLQPGNPDTLRNLTDYDIYLLSTLPRSARRFKIKIQSPPDLNPGNFGAIDVPNPASTNTGGNLYRDNISTCNNTTLGVGSVTPVQTGNMVGPTKQGIAGLCPIMSGDECRNSGGTMGLSVIVPLWSSNLVTVNGSKSVVIAQLASFELDSMTNQAEIIGAFLGKRVGGTLTNVKGTLRRPVLVR